MCIGIVSNIVLSLIKEPSNIMQRPYMGGY